MQTLSVSVPDSFAERVDRYVKGRGPLGPNQYRSRAALTKAAIIHFLDAGAPDVAGAPHDPRIGSRKRTAPLPSFSPSPAAPAPSPTIQTRQRATSTASAS